MQDKLEKTAATVSFNPLVTEASGKNVNRFLFVCLFVCMNFQRKAYLRTRISCDSRKNKEYESEGGESQSLTRTRLSFIEMKNLMIRKNCQPCHRVQKA